MQQNPEATLVRQLKEFGFIEEEPLAGAGMPFKIAQSRLNEQQDAVLGELPGKLPEQRPMEIVKAENDIPWTGREWIQCQIEANGFQGNPPSLRFLSRDCQCRFGNVGEGRGESALRQPERMTPRAARGIECPSAPLREIGLQPFDQPGRLVRKEPTFLVPAVPLPSFLG